MKIWIDDVRPMPEGYDIHCKTVDGFIDLFEYVEAKQKYNIDVVDLDHDAGDLCKFGGDYIKILEYFEKRQIDTGIRPDCIFKIHSRNPIGYRNMLNIIRQYGWKFEF